MEARWRELNEGRFAMRDCGICPNGLGSEPDFEAVETLRESRKDENIWLEDER